MAAVAASPQPADAFPHRARAAEYAYRALLAPSKQRNALCYQALGASPDCVEAYVLLAGDLSRSDSEVAALLSMALAAAQRHLDTARAAPARDAWRTYHATRTYLITRFDLARALWRAGDPAAAVRHCQELLLLDTADRLCVRHTLLGYLLAIGARELVADLLGVYPQDSSANWRFGRALQVFMMGGATLPAYDALAAARDGNAYAAAYLLGQRTVPAHTPLCYAAGTVSEAISLWHDQHEAWERTPGALAWLGA
jgi:hypothetical protein